VKMLTMRERIRVYIFIILHEVYFHLNIELFIDLMPHYS
jgi:hypothetical protein